MDYAASRMRFLVALAKRQGRNQAMCEVCMDRRATEVHHMGGRMGDMETDTRFFLGACHRCGMKVHAQPAWAMRNAYSVSRLGDATVGSDATIDDTATRKGADDGQQPSGNVG